MNGELYTLLSMAFRYWFCFLMLLIVVRAFRITRVDMRRARKLRDWAAETGCVGEFIVNPERGKNRVTVPVLREGLLGSSARADMRVRGRDFRALHAYLEYREGGILVRPRGRAKLILNEEYTGEKLFVRDGDTLRAGKTKLLLVLFAPESQKDKPRIAAPGGGEDWFDEAPRKAAPKRAEKKGAADNFSEKDIWPDA